MHSTHFFLSLIYGFIVSVTVVSGTDLQKCVLMGDPHIQMFHSVDAYPPPYKDCLDDGLLTVVKAPLVTLLVDVSNYWMIELYFTFRTRSNAPPFCSITSYDFTVGVVGDCASNGVNAILTDEYWWLTLSVTYPAANFSTVVTYYRWGLRFYNIEIWMPQDAATNALGVCSTPGCLGRTSGKRSVRSVRMNINNATGISNQTAGQICDAYIQTYLATLQRQPSQRDGHYNGTIESVRRMCVFDVVTAGADAAFGALQVLMIEEVTTGITNLTEVQLTFQRNVNQAFSNVVQVINETQAEVMEIINSTNTQAPIISTTTSSTGGSGTTTSSTGGNGTTTSTTGGSGTTTSTRSGCRTPTNSTDCSGLTTSTQLPIIPSAAPVFRSHVIYFLLFCLSNTLWFY